MMTPQLITKLPAYEMGEYKIHIRRPGTIARLELSEATPDMHALIRQVVSGEASDEVRLKPEDMRAIQGWVMERVSGITDADGAPCELPDGWLDTAGVTVALGMLHHILLFAAMADNGADPNEVMRTIEAQISASEEE